MYPNWWRLIYKYLMKRICQRYGNNSKQRSRDLHICLGLCFINNVDITSARPSWMTDIVIWWFSTPGVPLHHFNLDFLMGKYLVQLVFSLTRKTLEDAMTGPVIAQLVWDNTGIADLRIKSLQGRHLTITSVSPSRCL